MEKRIWIHFIQILTYRNDLIDIIRPFFEDLKNNMTDESFNFENSFKIGKNNQEIFSFFDSLTNYQCLLLHDYQLINQVIYKKYCIKRNISRPYSIQKESNIEKIIKEDNLPAFQQLAIENKINQFSFIKTRFNEVEEMEIPILIYTIIQKATKCFKYLLINGIGDPKESIMKPEQLDINSSRYEWDCMTIAIYYGEIEIQTILEEHGIEKGSKQTHLESALLSYRNSTAKVILNNLKEKINDEFNINSIFTLARNNNIKGIELFFKEQCVNNSNKLIQQEFVPYFLDKCIKSIYDKLFFLIFSLFLIFISHLRLNSYYKKYFKKLPNPFENGEIFLDLMETRKKLVSFIRSIVKLKRYILQK